MTTVSLIIRGLPAASEPALRQARADILAASSHELQLLQVRRLRQEIDRSTTRRTGRLRRVRSRGRVRRGDRPQLRLAPGFPDTSYVTRRGRRGQYAYVLDSSRRFIEKSGSSMTRDPEFRRIIARHARAQARKLQPAQENT